MPRACAAPRWACWPSPWRWPSPAGAAETPAWEQTLSRVAPSVVTIEVDQARAFDTEWNQSSQATGFVVDAELGLILTNRHVVTPGPVVATAVFQNREEVELHPVYRDPVHDFGFYRYDPAKLRYVQPVALPLYPEGARVGTEMRVVGNDAGEQLSILAGTLARLDREAPEYGVGKYNDFNTFYIQAASGTSGGSSGSPVIDMRGRVVALNAGGSTGAASSFYLPLGRVQRALELLRAGKPITRGTLQATFDYTPYDELERLGLRPETEALARRAAPDLTGMLVVREVQPGSPTEGLLQPGDILVRVNGQLVTTFEPLADAARRLRGQPHHRGGGAGRRAGHPVSSTCRTCTRSRPPRTSSSATPWCTRSPTRWRAISTRRCAACSWPIPGYALGAAGVPRGAVIEAVGGRPVATVDDFQAQVAGLADGSRATLRYRTLDDPRGTQTRVVRMDRRWFPAQHCRRDDATGYWPCQSIGAAPAPQPPAPAATTFPATGDAMADRLAPSLVMVNFEMPFSVAGVTERNYHGTGLVVDAKRGLVVVDRNTVPVAVGDVAHHLRRLRGDPGTRRLHPPAAQPRAGGLRPGAARRDADPGRASRPARAGARRDRDGRGPQRRLARALARDHGRRRSTTSISRCRARCSSAMRTSRWRAS